MKNMKIFIEQDLKFRNKETGVIVSNNEIEQMLILVIQYLKTITNDIPVDIKFFSIQTDRKINGDYLIPSFNGFGLPNISLEFTNQVLRLFHIDFPTCNKLVIKARRAFAKAKTEKEVMNVILCNAIMKIGSIGSRVTNRNTSYEICFKNLPTIELRKILSRSVNIINEDHRNREWEDGFMLTCVEEVSQFMDSINQRQLFDSIVEKVKQFEVKNHLDEHYKSNGGRILNYRESTVVEEYDLSKII